MAVARWRCADRLVPMFFRTLACHAISSPAATKPTLLTVLAGCRTTHSRAASQKFAPRPTSMPSQPRQIASASRPHEATAVAPAMRIGLRSRCMALRYCPPSGLGAHVLLHATLVVRGRWQPLTRRIDIGLTMVTCALLTWILFSGDVFQAPPTNQAMRLAIIVIVPIALVSLVRKMRNLRVRTALAARQ